MPFKFFKLPRTNLVRACCQAVVASLSIAGIVGASAQTPTPSPTPPAKKYSFIRFWNLLPRVGDNALELLSAENNSLSTDVPGNFYANYIPLAPGSYNFIIRRPADPTKPLKRVPVNLPAGTYATLMISMKDGQPVVETINDTVDPHTAGNGGRLVIRQYMPGLHVTVSVNDGPKTSVINFGEVQVLDHLPTSQIAVNAQATSDNGPLVTWTVPADFTTYCHGTLLIVPDRYGHFRPRVTVDGHEEIPPPSGPAH